MVAWLDGSSIVLTGSKCSARYALLSVVPKVPVAVGPRLAFVVVVLDLTWVVLEWYHPWLWSAAQARVPWLSATGVAGAFALFSALALTVVPCRLSWRD